MILKTFCSLFYPFGLCQLLVDPNYISDFGADFAASCAFTLADQKFDFCPLVTRRNNLFVESRIMYGEHTELGQITWKSLRDGPIREVNDRQCPPGSWICVIESMIEKPGTVRSYPITAGNYSHPPWEDNTVAILDRTDGSLSLTQGSSRGGIDIKFVCDYEADNLSNPRLLHEERHIFTLQWTTPYACSRKDSAAVFLVTENNREDSFIDTMPMPMSMSTSLRYEFQFGTGDVSSCLFTLADQEFDLCPLVRRRSEFFVDKYSPPNTYTGPMYNLDQGRKCPPGIWVCITQITIQPNTALYTAFFVGYPHPQPEDEVTLSRDQPNAVLVFDTSDGSLSLQIISKFTHDRVSIKLTCDPGVEEPSRPRFPKDNKTSHTFEWATPHACGRQVSGV